MLSLFSENDVSGKRDGLSTDIGTAGSSFVHGCVDLSTTS